MDWSSVQKAVDQWLAHEPMTVEELAARVLQAGLVPADGVDEGAIVPAATAAEEEDDDATLAIKWLIESSDSYWTTRPADSEPRIHFVPTFVDTGMTLTHRLTSEELESGKVTFAPDLSIIDWDQSDGIPLADGSGSLYDTFVRRRPSLLHGPQGWLDGYQSGDLLAFTRTDGAVAVTVVPDEKVGDGTAEVDALREAARRWIGDGRGEEEVPVVMEAMARNPRLFRAPVRPMGELLAGAGLEQRDQQWGWAGEKWQTSRELQAERVDRVARRRYDFEACCHHAYDRVRDAYRAHLDGAAIDGAATRGAVISSWRLAEALGHGNVIPAFVTANLLDLDDVAGFAQAAVTASTRGNKAPAFALHGFVDLRKHDPLAAVDKFTEGLRVDPVCQVAARALGDLELDRGDLSRAYTLAVQGDRNQAQIDWIKAEQARQASLRPPAVGRNEPCPCGSGRKAKKCCGTQPPLSVVQRLPFVLQRLAHYATGPEGRSTWFDLLAWAADDAADPEAALRLLTHDTFIIGLVVHEGGLGARYLSERLDLLSEDEAELLEEAFEEPLRLWEVVDIDGYRLTLRDADPDLGDDEVVVTTVVGLHGEADRICDVGKPVLARLATVEGRPVLLGQPVPVPPADSERVAEMLDDWPLADQLARWYGSVRFA